MANHQLQTAVCQACGRGFLLTKNYSGMLARWGAKVKTPVLCPTCFLKAGHMPKQRGKVKWFNKHKRYGFLVTSEGEEVFFHQQQIVAGGSDEACEDRPVRFHVREAAKGPEALNVEFLPK